MVGEGLVSDAARGTETNLGIRAGEWRMVGALTSIAVLAMLDRHALSLFVGPLKADLGLSDAQVGAAVGTGFAIAHVAVTLPAGWIADRWDRRLIVFVGIVFWSLMTILCGLATTFTAFLLARAAVGLGEGVIPPASYSLIRDGVARQRHGRAFGFFAMANTFGPGSAILLGGILLGAIATFHWHALPLLGELRPWQFVLIVLGVAGLPLSALAFAFSSPPRARSPGEVYSYAMALRQMRHQKAIFVPLAAFSISCAIVSSALAIWFPAFVGRVWGLSPQAIGPRLGVLLMVAGPAGMLIAGIAMDSLGRRNRSGPGIVAICVSVLLFVCASTVVLVPSQQLMWLLEGGVVFCSTCYFAIVSTVVSRTVPASMIGKAMAVMLVVQGVVGAGLAPLLVGWLSDAVYGGGRGIGAALATNAAVFMAIGIASAFFLARALQRPPNPSPSPVIPA
jgi:MFS family permease